MLVEFRGSCRIGAPGWGSRC
ncbi:E3 ubiquitin-protein ligase MBR2 [Zea mays]|uniref:E3 ubiquitin-protein ligase MBR2 n=1 Tax=Zea mays TaxID=4577 RepID=A0A1D6LYM4_MAIZE|nr:E3 ubiquitin-protein ligase MBR2 [Zea mays]AQK84252.1 E3 ubiquitin-protein ligase MBR2 [Zea mays]